MQDLSGKTAFVTGGASGIGLALGHAFAEAGMQVMLADIEEAALTAAVDQFKGSGHDVRGVLCDVTDPASVDQAAQTAIEAFGPIHVVCNNAGVAGGGGIDDISLEEWRWVLDVNLMGVLHGVKTFLPHMRAHGQGGHFVNTASLAGMQSEIGFSAYSASKFAVVTMSEGLAKQVAPLGIGVSVLCPHFVKTGISDSQRNRPDGAAQSAPAPDSAAAQLSKYIKFLVQNGTDPADVAIQTLEAIRANELYIFTHPQASFEVENRFAAIQAAMDKAAARGVE
jgi:NAD(P)-dependent dehydrogenase (short-subunit alcohol dehydrogenase family)